MFDQHCRCLAKSSSYKILWAISTYTYMYVYIMFDILIIVLFVLMSLGSNDVSVIFLAAMVAKASFIGHKGIVT